MKNLVNKIMYQYGKIIKYALCSVVTALLEMVIGWLLLHLLTYGIVVANTASIIMGAFAHYFLTMLLVFEKKNNTKSFIVYVTTFVLGLLMQNAIIWAFYEQLLADKTESLRYVVSKVMSLVIPFFLLYYIRNYLNQKIKGYNLK